MTLGSTQPLTEMSTRNLPGGNGRPACEADNLTAICEPIGQKMCEPWHLTTLWVFTACYKDSFTFYGVKIIILASCPGFESRHGDKVSWRRCFFFFPPQFLEENTGVCPKRDNARFFRDPL
jgi:hypothetical protein